MKRIIVMSMTFLALYSCKTHDKSAAANGIPQEEKRKALKDSANFTTIQWLDSTFKDLGKVEQGQQIEVSYRFKNTGDKNLIIAEVTASCGCTVPEKPLKPIAPGEEGVIKAKFDSNGRPVGEARKEVYVTANTKPSVSQSLTFRVEITKENK